jgi:hypothetical protein
VTAPSLHEQQLRDCPECNTALVGRYCHECGEKPPDPHDLTLKHFFHHGLHELTHVDSKIFRTLRMLIGSPGVLTADYLAGRKQRYVLPLRLFLVVFALNFFLYTRPGVALYDIRFILSASPQGKGLEARFEHSAEKRHITKDELFKQLNEHWQHNVSFFQLGDVFFFAICLAMVNRRRYFAEHLIFSLHALSFSFLLGSVTWLYYWRYGFRQNYYLLAISLAVLLLYLWRAVSKVYATTGGGALLRALFLVFGLELSRMFFISFTMIVAMVQTVRAH